MKKAMMLALALAASTSLAAPFVYPATWTSNKPGDVQTGGTFRSVNLQDFKTLNPFVSSESPNLPAVLSAGSLLGYNPVTGNYAPYMAEKYTQSADKRTFTFDIRKGMKWSDGKAITVDDWITAYTIDSNKDVGSNTFDYWTINNQPIKVTKVDSNTLKVVFPKADVTAIEFLSGIFLPQPTHVFMPVWKSKGAEGIKDMWTISTNPDNIVTSGPFMLDRYVRGERAILKKNPYFGEWNKDSAGKSLPYMDGIQINIVADANAQLAQFLAGNLDTYSPDNRDRLAQVKSAMDGGKVKGVLIPNASARASSDFMVFNMDDSSTFKTKLFSNVKFRQAMSMLMNRDAMVDLALGGLGQATYTSVYPVYKDWIPSGMDKYKFNPTAAAKLLGELGFKKGKDGILVDKAGNKLEFTLITNAENTRRQTYAKVIQDEAKKVGVKINTSFIAFNQMTTLLDAKENFGRRNFDAIIIGLTGGGQVYPVSGPSVVECKGLGDGGNLHMFNQSNKCRFPFETQAVNLFWKGRAEFDLAKRKAIAAQIQKNEMENQPYIQLAAQTVHFAWTDRVQGEYNRPQINSLNASTLFGPRDIALTWIKR